jgi:two-component system, NarL family, sensor histidine kinase BarA
VQCCIEHCTHCYSCANTLLGLPNRFIVNLILSRPGLILVNYFRQLTLPWLIALLVMVLLTGMWYQFETQSQRQRQIEQFMATLQVSIRPLLTNNDAALFKSQLNTLRHTSIVPLTSIAIFNQNNKLLAATDMPASLNQFVPNTPVNQFSLHWYQDMLLALQPLSVGVNTDPIQSQYFILTAFEPDTTHSVWLLPTLIVALVGGAVLLIVQTNLLQQFQRLQTDIGLINHKISQLRHGQQDVHLNEELVPELAALKPALNALAQYQADLCRQHQAQCLQQQQENKALQHQYDVVQQQLSQAQQQYQLQQHRLQNRWQNLLQLYQQQAELDDITFRQVLSAQLTLLQTDTELALNNSDTLLLTDAVASALPVIRRWLSGQKIDLQLFEGEDNALYIVQINAELFTALLLALVQLGGRAASVTELTLRVHLQVQDTTNQATLHLSVSSNGDGISAQLRQRLLADNTAPIQWHETDIGIVLALKRQLDATMNIQLLDGLGSAITFQLPLSKISTVTAPKLQHVLLLEPAPGNLAERGQSMGSQAAHLVKCADLAELILKSKQYLYDLAVIILPEPTDLAQWQQVLQELNARCRLLCYASAGRQAIWQEALHLTVQEGPFCLADMQTTSLLAKQLPCLLVVDDNPTNLAFVQILLKEQAVQLYTAKCGVEALKYCQQQQFDAILLDIQLPDLPGTEVARQLRQLKSYQQTPILAFTAHALDDEVIAFKQAGMNDVIIKPLEAAKLDQILRWCSVGKTDNVG